MSKTPWHDWKEKQLQRRTTGSNVKPIDLFLSDSEFAEPQLQDERYAVCTACDRLTKTTKQCRECGCFMKLKVKLADATCPLGKW